MQYDDFNKDFVERTLKIMEAYNGEYKVTLLINCLTGLLILPKEKCYANIPDDPIQDLTDDWGVKKEHIKQVRCECCGYNLKNVVRCLRNSVAHMKIKAHSEGEDNEITMLEFKDTGFKAEIPIDALEIFAIKLATSVV
jgi:hypothetical protein